MARTQSRKIDYRIFVVGIAIVALVAFVFLQNKPAPQDELSIQPGPNKAIRIERSDPSSVTIRNIAGQTLQSSDIVVYIDSQIQSCSWSGSVPITPGGVATCGFQGNCNPRQIIKVVAPGNLDQTSC